MTDKKKILIPINSDLYIRNYIKTEAFNMLKKKYSLFSIFVQAPGWGLQPLIRLEISWPVLFQLILELDFLHQL